MAQQRGGGTDLQQFLNWTPEQCEHMTRRPAVRLPASNELEWRNSRRRKRSVTENPYSQWQQKQRSTGSDAQSRYLQQQVKSLMALLSARGISLQQLAAMRTEEQYDLLHELALANLGGDATNVAALYDIPAALKAILQMAYTKSSAVSPPPVSNTTQRTVANGRMYARHTAAEVVPKGMLLGETTPNNDFKGNKGLDDVIFLRTSCSAEQKVDSRAVVKSEIADGVQLLQFPDARSRMLEVIRRTPLGKVKPQSDRKDKSVVPSPVSTPTRSPLTRRSAAEDHSITELPQSLVNDSFIQQQKEERSASEQQIDYSNRSIKEFEKYFKLVQLGIPKESIIDKMIGEGAVASPVKAAALLESDPTLPLPYNFFHPQFDHETNSLPTHAAAAQTNSASLISRKTPIFDEKQQMKMIPIAQHDDFKVYFEMLALGLPREAVRVKMLRAGLDGKVIDKNPTDLVPAIRSDPPLLSNAQLYLRKCEQVEKGIRSINMDPSAAAAAQMQYQNWYGDYQYGGYPTGYNPVEWGYYGYDSWGYGNGGWNGFDGGEGGTTLNDGTDHKVDAEATTINRNVEAHEDLATKQNVYNQETKQSDADGLDEEENDVEYGDVVPVESFDLNSSFGGSTANLLFDKLPAQDQRESRPDDSGLGSERKLRNKRKEQARFFFADSVTARDQSINGTLNSGIGSTRSLGSKASTNSLNSETGKGSSSAVNRSKSKGTSRARGSKKSSSSANKSPHSPHVAASSSWDSEAASMIMTPRTRSSFSSEIQDYHRFRGLKPAFIGLNSKVSASEHPLYGRFFAMLKDGRSVDEIKELMRQANLNADIIDQNPTDMLPVIYANSEQQQKEEDQMDGKHDEDHSDHEKIAEEEVDEKDAGAPTDEEQVDDTVGAAAAAAANEGDEEEMVKLSEHPKYAKFFKMLKIRMPPPAIKMKMEQEGLDPSIIDRSPDELVPLNDKKDEMVKVSEHPTYAKFFKMLKIRMPPPAIKMKMEQDGLDPNILDKDPDEMVPLHDKKSSMVKAIDHPQYGKFFAMKREGDMPLEDIQQQMQAAGLDPQVIHLNSMELIPLDAQQRSALSAVLSPVKLGAAAAAAFASSNAAGGTPPLQKLRRKKLHVKTLDPGKVQHTLWANLHEEFALHVDEEEFRSLFIKDPAEEEAAAKAKAEAAKKKEKSSKKKVVLVDHKRAQNAGIALARIKFPCRTIRTKIEDMHGDGITTDQLRSLEEFLPTPEEEEKVKAYKGDPELLGLAEQYMLQMVGFRSEAVERIQCMIYKQLFKLRVNECKSKLHKIENACDDVKMSGRLRKVLKAILKVVNQMNDGEEHRGFTLDSLLKLQSTKAFDQKTSVLQYIINLIHRKDKDPLLFPEDLKHVAEASRINLDALSNDIDLLRSEFDNSFQVVIDIEESTPSPHSGAMLDFFARAETQCKELAKNFEDAKKKMTGVLAYFGEETHLSSIDFFSTLNRFVQEFKHTREVVERIHNAELKAKREEEARAAAAARKEAEAKNPKRQSSSGAKAQDLSPISSPEKLLEELSPAEQRQLRRQRRRSTADLRKLSIDIRSPSQEERRHIAAESPLPGDTSDSATRGSPDREDLSSDGSPIRSSLRLRPQSTRAVSKVNSFNREESEDVSNSDVEGNGNAANLKSKMPGLPRKKREGIAIDRSTSAESVGDDLFSQPSTPLKPSQIKNRNRSMIEMRIPSLGKTKSSYNFDLLGGDDIQPTAPPVADTVVDVSVPVATDAAAVRSRVQERRERRERRRSSAAAAKDQSTPTVHDATAAAPSVTTTAKGTGEDDSLNQSIMAQATEDNIQPLHAGDAHSPLSLTPLVSPERRQGEEEDQPNLDLSEAEMSAALSTSTTTALDESVDTNAVPGIDPDERETVEDGGATGSTDEGRHIEEVDAVSADITSTTSKIVENSVTPEIKEASLPSSPPPPPPHADLARPLSILKSPGTKSPGRKKSARFAQNPVAGCSNDPSHSIDDASTAVHTDEVDIQQAKEVADVPLIVNEELVEEAVAAAEPSTATATITTAVDADERVTTAVTETVSTFSPEELAATIPATDIEKAAARVLSNSNTQSAASSASRSHSSSNENVLSTTEESRSQRRDRRKQQILQRRRPSIEKML